MFIHWAPRHLCHFSCKTGHQLASKWWALQQLHLFSPHGEEEGCIFTVGRPLSHPILDPNTHTAFWGCWAATFTSWISQACTVKIFWHSDSVKYLWIRSNSLLVCGHGLHLWHKMFPEEVFSKYMLESEWATANNALWVLYARFTVNLDSDQNYKHHLFSLTG